MRQHRPGESFPPDLPRDPAASTEVEASQPPSRRSFLRRSMQATSAILPATALAASSTGQVVHAQVGGRPGQVMPGRGAPDLYPGQNARTFRSIQRHENDHVAFLAQVLGTAAPRPQFVGLNMPNVRTFELVSRALENTGVGAYTGAAPLISSDDVLTQAGRIATIESRHAGFLNTLLNFPYSNFQAFETPLSPTEVATQVAAFLADPRQIFTLASAISTTPSSANDINILRFAFALELLEAEFYNINVPRFFR